VANQLCVPNLLVQRAVIDRALQVFEIKISGDTQYLMAMDEFLLKNDIAPLCAFVQKNIFNLTTKKESWNQHNEAVTQSVFVACMLAQPLFSVKMEHQIKVGEWIKSWVDAIAFQKTDKDNNTDNKARKCILLEFKNKKAEFLYVPGANTLEKRVSMLKEMDDKAIKKVKVHTKDQFHANQTMQQLLDAGFQQGKEYALDLMKEDPNLQFHVHAILSVGSSHILSRSEPVTMNL